MGKQKVCDQLLPLVKMVDEFKGIVSMTYKNIASCSVDEFNEEVVCKFKNKPDLIICVNYDSESEMIKDIVKGLRLYVSA